MNMNSQHLVMSVSLEQCLDDIIFAQELTVLFQPIINNRSREIFGFEALIRGPSNSPLHSPIHLFQAAVKHGRMVELERLCRTVAIKQFKLLNLPGKLFLNASPEALTQPDFKSGCTLNSLQDVGLDANRVVIELTEQYALEDYGLLREALLHYKKMGFEIAIDDLGAGYAGLRMWSELRPDYVKIDRHFMQDIHEDKVKQEFVRSINNIASELNCRVIGEGVETLEEYHAVRKIGLEFTQGYYFSRPKELPEISVSRRLFEQAPKSLKRRNGGGHLSKNIGELMQCVPGISAMCTVEETVHMFNNAPQLESIPVVDGCSPIGLIRRNTLNNIMISEYGRYLYGKKPIEPFVDTNTLILESYLPIEEASCLVSEHINKDKELDFIIADEGCYRGIASVIDLLKVITAVQIRSARHANPLTLLPGNVPIYEELDCLLREQRDFVVCYFDLDNFKPYNDSYGYEKGDQVLKGLADVLREGVDNKKDFVGHIGGDDFIVTFLSTDWQARCEAMMQDFEERLEHYYKREDLEQSGIWAEDRTGQRCFLPLLSLSIGCVHPDPAVCESHHAVATLATDAKHMAKKQAGNSLFIERRRHP
tara:strand:+ start:781 stop:2562 length:1782 start_codon:yes stop_codon:yes gene_type:complete